MNLARRSKILEGDVKIRMKLRNLIKIIKTTKRKPLIVEGFLRLLKQKIMGLAIKF